MTLCGRAMMQSLFHPLPFIHPSLQSSGLSLVIMSGESSANRLVKLQRCAAVCRPRSALLLTKTLRLPVCEAVMKSGRAEASLCGLTALSANRNSSAEASLRDVWLLHTQTHFSLCVLVCFPKNINQMIGLITFLTGYYHDAFYIWVSR